MDEIEEAIDALERIDPHMMIAIDETRYLHLGQLAVLCIKKLKELQELTHDDTRH